jgi:hypothetical protein
MLNTENVTMENATMSPICIVVQQFYEEFMLSATTKCTRSSHQVFGIFV